MKYILAYLALVGGFFMHTAHADISLSLGSEYFFWEEFEPFTGDALLDESGWRSYAALKASTELSEDWRIGGMGKVYGGDVAYDGELTNGTPYSTTTTYQGFNGELLLNYRLSSVAGNVTDLDFGLGLDRWSRDLAGPYGYIEEYLLYYGKLGFSHQRTSGWSWMAGALLPLRVDERVELYDGFNVEPQGYLSVYAGLGYRFASNWELGLDVSTYRFKRSDPVQVYSQGVAQGYFLQPESHQTSASLSIGYRF